MSTWMRRGDFWSGLALALLGAYIVGQARGWVYLGEDGPGAGFFPMWYGSAMIALSLLLVAGTVLKAARAATPPEPVQWRDLGRALACWAAFVACIALMPLIGFVISFALLTWFIVRVMAGERQAIAVGLAIAGSIAFYVLFEWALDLSLPRGLLF